MPAPALVKRDWVKDHVYLVQFPRAGCIPTPSPFALKLETWLRLCKIPYSNVSNQFKIMSSKGKIPFIELNGRQFADSVMIIEQLKHDFKKDPDANLSDKERSQFGVYRAFIEDSLFWTLVYNRGRDFKWLATEEGFAGHLTAVKKFVFTNLLLGKMQKKVAAGAFAQGIGRHNQLEVEKMAKEGFDSLESFIGNKDFFFGSNPSTLDVTAFGLLQQYLHTPLLSGELKSHLETKCPNLVRMVNRLKTDLWPDWEEACKTLSLDTHEKKEEEKKE